MLGARRLFDGVRVIQQHAEVADAAYAGFGADRRHPRFDTRIAEDALLGLPALPVEVDFFVRAACDAHTPAAAFVLVNQHDAVFFTFVNCAARAGRHARRVQAVLAQAREIHHEGVFELAVHRLLHVFEVLVLRTFFELAAQDLFPVRAGFDFVHSLAGNQRARAGNRLVFAFRRVMQMLIVVVERLVVIVDARQMRVGENFAEQHPAAAHARLQFAVDFAHPAALPLLLVFPVVREADARLAFDVVEPGVFHPFAAGPDVFTGHRTGVAADALIKVQHHADL